MKKLNESDMRKAYEVEFRDDRNGATSSIDTIFADGNYTAEDYIEDCMLNADDEWNEMLSHGEVVLHEIDLQESLFEDTKDVSIDKMSKKDRKAFYDKQRNVWGRSPVTKTKPSDKIYDRKKFKKDDLNESGGEKQRIVPDKNYHVLHWVAGEDKARDYGNLPGKDIKGMLRGYKYEDDLDMWFSKSGNSGYFITEIKESLDEADEVNKETNDNSSGNSNKCPNCGRNLVKDSTGLHCPVCDKKHSDSEYNTSSKGIVTEEISDDDTFDVADFEPHNKDEHEFEHDDDIKGIEEIKL